MSEEQSVIPDEQKEVKKRIFTPWMLVLLVLFVGLFICLKACLSSSREGGKLGEVQSQQVVTPSPVAPDPTATERLRQQRLKELELRKTKNDLALRMQQYEDAMRAHYNAFLSGLPPYDATQAFKVAREGVEFIASKEGLCGWRVCVSLAYKMAYDKVKGTSRTEEAIAPIVAQHVEAPLAKACIPYNEIVKRCQEKMLLETTAFQTDCALLVTNLETFLSGLTLLNHTDLEQIGTAVEGMEKQIQEIAVKKASIVVGTVIEAVFIRSTYALAKRLLASAAAKMVGSVGTAVTTAIADGPLPIGDIISGVILIGGTAWTMGDIYQATEAMPKELRREMYAAIDEYQRSLETNAKDGLKQYASTLEQSAKNEYANMLQILEKTK